MSTSGFDRRLARAGLADLTAAIGCAVFGGVYEYFSHGVWSGHLVYAFLFLLVGGALPCSALALSGCRHPLGRWSLGLYHAGLAALTAGSLMQGALEIYGTSSSLIRFYGIGGGILLSAGALVYLAGRIGGLAPSAAKRP